MAVANCPACAHLLKKRPQRKTKCPSCGGFIYVKYSPTNREKRLVTEAEANEIETQWAAYHERQGRLQSLRSYGVTDQDYDKAKALLAPNFDNQSLDWQTTYFLCNELLSKESRLHYRKMLYFHLARLLDEKDLDFRSHLRKGFESELEGHKKKGEIVIGVEIVTSGLSEICGACQKNAGKVYPLDDAIREMPLPCEGCACRGLGHLDGFCQCYYRTILTGENHLLKQASRILKTE